MRVAVKTLKRIQVGLRRNPFYFNPLVRILGKGIIKFDLLPQYPLI